MRTLQVMMMLMANKIPEPSRYRKSLKFFRAFLSALLASGFSSVAMFQSNNTEELTWKVVFFVPNNGIDNSRAQNRSEARRDYPNIIPRISPSSECLRPPSRTGTAVNLRFLQTQTLAAPPDLVNAETRHRPQGHRNGLAPSRHRAKARPCQARPCQVCIVQVSCELITLLVGWLVGFFLMVLLDACGATTCCGNHVT